MNFKSAICCYLFVASFFLFSNNVTAQNTVSGTVYNDLDGSAKGTFTNIQTGAETGTNGNGTLWVYVVKASTDEILATAVVAVNGTYTSSSYSTNGQNRNIYLVLDTVTRAVASNISAFSTIKMPAAWANTTPYMTVDIDNGGTNLTNQNFGIQKDGFLIIPDFSTCAGSDSLFTWYFRGAATNLVNGTTIVENSGASTKIPFLKVTARYFTNNLSYSVLPKIYAPASYTIAGAGGAQPLPAILEYKNSMLEITGSSTANGVNNDSIGISVAFKNTNGQKMYIQKLNNAVLDLDTYESIKVIGYINGVEVRPVIYVSNGYADNATNDMRSFYIGNKAWIYDISSGFQAPSETGCNAWCDYNYNAVAIMEFPTPVDSVFFTARITEPTGHRDYDAASVGSNEITSFKYCPINIAGNLWNDVNGNGIIDGTETNILNSGSYINMVDEYGRVLASVPVQPDGTYTFPYLPQLSTTSPMKLQISSTLGTVGSLPPATGAPAGYGAVSENPGGGSPEILPAANMEISLPLTLNTFFSNQNFGIQRLPESAVNSQVIGANPGGTNNVTINSNWFSTSNVGVNPNTQDYDGGTVDNIRIISFPSNATSITIGTTTYYANAGAIPGTCPTTTCLVWPIGGVTIAAPGGVPSLPISVDPVSGLVAVVITFAAIDNTGKEDLTPGSVTLIFTSTLPIKLESFTAKAISCAMVELNWKVSDAVNFSRFEIERSINGVDFITQHKINYDAGIVNYQLNENVFTNGLYQYRVKMIDVDGKSKYSSVVFIRLDCNDQRKLLIYPNPAKDKITISGLKGGERVAMYNAQGQLVYKKGNTAYQLNIGMENIANGIYTIIVINKNGEKVSETKITKAE